MSKGEKMSKEVIAWNPPVEWVKEQIENAGTTIGSVHFNKRKSGDLRKMSYRLHVTNPSTAKTPSGKKGKKKDIDQKNRQMTVLDANKVVRDKEGKVIGRGAWRTVPLENVVRISNKGVVYEIKRT